MKNTSHRFVTGIAINEINDPLLMQKRRSVVRGVLSMDKRYFLGIPAAKHYYDPASGKGLFGYLDAKSQALRLYRRAVKKKSFYLLGKMLHLLQDMAIPAHTQNKLHYFMGEDLENYLAKHQKKILFKVKEINETELSNLFDDIAEQSRKLESINSVWHSVLFIFNLKKKLPAEELERQARLALSRATSYSIVVMKRFMRAIRN